MKLFYTIRVVGAEDTAEAIRKVEENLFEEGHPVCDKVLTAEEIRKAHVHHFVAYGKLTGINSLSLLGNYPICAKIGKDFACYYCTA